MALRVCGTFLSLLSLLLLGAQVAAAQVRQISGRVTNAQTEQGLGGAPVAVNGTGIVAETSDYGSCILNAPDGDQPGSPPDVVFPTLPIPTAELQPRT